MTFVALSAVPGDDIYPLNGATAPWESRAGRGGERRGGAGQPAHGDQSGADGDCFGSGGHVVAVF